MPLLIWPHRTRCPAGPQHKLTFSIVPSILVGKIQISGAHWAEPTGSHKCELHWELSVDVNVAGIGSTVTRGIRDGCSSAYATTPARVVQYMGTDNKELLAELAKRAQVARSRWHSALIALHFAKHQAIASAPHTTEPHVLAAALEKRLPALPASAGEVWSSSLSHQLLSRSRSYRGARFWAIAVAELRAALGDQSHAPRSEDCALPEQTPAPGPAAGQSDGKFVHGLPLRQSWHARCFRCWQ